MTLYANYLREREGKKVLEYEDVGFATYEIIEPGVVYIANIYVAPQSRRLGIGSAMADEVVAITQSKILIGSIDPNTNGAHESMLGLIAYGMKLWKTEHGLVYFRKDVG